MEKSLDSYIKFYRNFIPQELIDETVYELETTNDYRKHEYGSGYKEDSSFSYEDDLYVTGNISTSPKIMKIIWQSLQNYMIDINFSWINTWRGFSPVRFNKYPTGSNMRNHCDHIHSIFPGERKGIPILSILGSLNNDYTGGELIFFENEIVELKAGDIMVFPSIFLYPHRVETVKSGTRYSFVSWTW